MYDPTRDPFVFLRRRAEQLVDEGYTEQALRLLQHVDKTQIRLIHQLLKDGKKLAR